MTTTKFHPEVYTQALTSKSVSYASPSNIALIKYWGKHGVQIPKNPSISFTLDTCKTTTKLSYIKREEINDEYELKVILDGKHKPGFEPKIHQFFGRIESYLTFVKDYLSNKVLDNNSNLPASKRLSNSINLEALETGL